MQALKETTYLKRPEESRESLGELLGELVTHATSLLKDEVELAKTELREKVTQYISAVLTIAVGVMLAILGTGSLCIAAIVALGKYLGLGWAALVVGAILAAVAGILIALGISYIRRINPKLEKTMDSLEEDIRTLEGE